MSKNLQLSCLGLGLVAFVAMLLCPRIPSPVGSAIATLTANEFDFGSVKSGQVLKTQFQLKNDGDRRLIIRQSSKSCECVHGINQPIILRPGESTRIEATMDTNRLVGSFQMELQYVTSEKNLPKFDLILLANVIESFPSETD